MVTQQPNSLRELGIISCDDPTFAGCDVLGWSEAEHRRAPETSDRSPPVTRPMGLSCVLNQGNARALRDGCQFRKVGWLTTVLMFLAAAALVVSWLK